VPNTETISQPNSEDPPPVTYKASHGADIRCPSGFSRWFEFMCPRLIFRTPLPGTNSLPKRTSQTTVLAVVEVQLPVTHTSMSSQVHKSPSASRLAKLCAVPMVDNHVSTKACQSKAVFWGPSEKQCCSPVPLYYIQICDRLFSQRNLVWKHSDGRYSCRTA
jgi:hypothetical protein